MVRFFGHTVVEDLLSIKVSYESLIELLDKFEDNEFTVDTGYNTLCNMKFKNDPVGIKSYCEKRLTISKAVYILKNSNVIISPEDYFYLYNYLTTTVVVERSFSMLRKLLAKDCNLKAENIYKYFTLYYNKSGD